MPTKGEVIEAVNKAFRPHYPIEEEEAFQGRETEKDRVEEGILFRGLHALIFGGRGAGKTSLANVSVSKHENVNVFCPKAATFGDLVKSIMDQLNAGGYGKFHFDASADQVIFEGRHFRMSQLGINDLLLVLPKEKPLCIVLDELDRLESVQAREGVGELCKAISTFHSHITMVMVGVAETAEELLRGHASNNRNLKQVHLGRMRPDDLRAILRRGEEVLGIKYDVYVEDRIIAVSDRYPFYVHLLGANAAISTLMGGRRNVTKEDYQSALKKTAEDSDETLSSHYNIAIASVQGSQIYRQVLWAMAESDNALMPVGGIAEKANEIIRREGGQRVTVQAVGQGVRTLTEEKKRSILLNQTNGHYRFANPLMRGYIRMVSEAE